MGAKLPVEPVSGFSAVGQVCLGPRRTHPAKPLPARGKWGEEGDEPPGRVLLLPLPPFGADMTDAEITYLIAAAGVVISGLIVLYLVLVVYP